MTELPVTFHIWLLDGRFVWKVKSFHYYCSETTFKFFADKTKEYCDNLNQIHNMKLL